MAVLSNNDGYVIARSEEVKEVGVPMGAPLFKLEDTLEEIEAEVLSSNYTLYGDMSRRVHALIEEEALAFALERYSIDEAFAALPDLERENLQCLTDSIRRKVLRQVGVPVRVGIGPTKTLAKVADENAKARKRAGWEQGTYVCQPEPEREELLRRGPVGDIWGIGSAYEEALKEKGVASAAEFRALPDLQLVRPNRKTLVRSRSFGERVETKVNLRGALAKHSQRAAEKLREENLVAKGIKVFITTKRFGDPPHYSNGVAGSLGEHTARGASFARASRQLLEPIYRSGYGYKKAGV